MRKALVQEYENDDVSLFGSVEQTVLPQDGSYTKEERTSIEEKIKLDKVLINRGYHGVLEKVKILR